MIKILKKFKKKKKITLFNKNIILFPCFSNKKINIYNGKKLNEIIITKNKLIKSIGKFVLTRKSPMNSKRWKKK